MRVTVRGPSIVHMSTTATTIASLPDRSNPVMAHPVFGHRHGADTLLVFDPRPSTVAPTVDIVVPVHNEDATLEASIRRLHAYLGEHFPLSWQITIADNASTDHTWGLACSLAQKLEGVRAAHLEAKGRGRALRAVWSRSASPVVAYMDVDLSTDLDALLPLVAPLVSGHSDVAIGTRLASTSRVVRRPQREVISRSYNLILRTALRAGFSDAQCGFKALRGDVAHALLPMVQDQGWFFDTELLVLAEHNGMRIHEVPVDWVDDPDSRVNVVTTARDDLRGVWRMVRAFARGEGLLTTPVAGTAEVPDSPTGEQLARFASIGIVSTVAFAVLFATLAGPLGVVLADVVALALCTIANTAANRRLTFNLRGRTRRTSHHVRGLVAAGVPLIVTLATLAVTQSVGITSVLVLVAVLTVANALASAAKLVLLRSWVFRPRLAVTVTVTVTS